MTVPSQMQAISITQPGGPEVLTAVQCEVPRPRDNEVLIQVAAAGVNRPDVLQRMGRYPVPADAEPGPGLEVAGTVVACGSTANRWSPGDAVCALTHGGGYAEYCRVHQDHCLPVPGGLSMTQAAALPETLFTVWYNVFTRCRMRSGEWFLVHGGSSGIGSTAIQLAKAFGSPVITTAGTDEKCRYCLELGSDHALNYRSEDWEAAVMQITRDRGVDVILDMVGGDYLAKNLAVLARDGRCSLIASLGGPRAEINIMPIMLKRLTITGSTLRPQTVKEKAQIATDLEQTVWPWIEDGIFSPSIFAEFPLDQAAAAHRLMDSGTHMGKIVLEVR